MGDFEVDTNGQCFLCMDNIIITLRTSSVNLKEKEESVHSLQYLSRYLKINMRKVFDEEGIVPPELLAKVEKARLKVELCQGCVCLNESFSKLYRKLEKIEMEMASQVELIHKKLLKSVHDLDMDMDYKGERFNGRLKIAQALRNEAKQKCFSKMKASAAPRVKLQNWSVKKMDSKKLKIQCHPLNQRKWVSESTANSNNSEIVDGSGSSVKEEAPTIDSHLGYDDAGNDYFDDYDGHYDESSTLHLVKPVTRKAEAVVVGNVDAKDNFTVTNGSIVTTHFKIEAGIYECRVCCKKFATKTQWQLHYQNSHLKVRYKCNICGKEFVQQGHYKRHYESIHVGVKFKCLLCNKTFKRRDKLTHHQRKTPCKTGNAT